VTEDTALCPGGLARNKAAKAPAEGVKVGPSDRLDIPDIYATPAEELERISTSCRGYLLELERERILSPLQREIVIDRLVALDGDEVDIDRLKWLVLMVLSSQPGQEQACARMEHLMFEDPEARPN